MKNTVAELLGEALQLSVDDILPALEYPPSREQGDIAFPCFQLARTLKKAPVQIAAELLPNIEALVNQSNHLAAVKQAGPYLNFFFDREAYTLTTLQEDVQKQLEAYQTGKGQNVIVEYSSPNIAKHFKLYHIRSTMIGQALANIHHALGYNVERINHIGDWGTQFGKLIAAYTMWGNEEQIKQDPITELVALYVKFHEEAESNPALEDEGRLWFKRLEEGDAEAVRLWKWFGEESMKEFQKIYSLLGVTFDHELGESFYTDKMDAVMEELEAKGLLEKSEGALVVRLDEQNIPPCILKKSDGASIYATRDMAAALYREQQFKPDKMLYVVDQRQALHFQQVFSVLKKMGYAFADNCEHISFGIMKVEGEIGSTRKGHGVELTDVLDQAMAKARQIIDEKNPNLPNKEEVAQSVGVGAIVFNDLKHHRTHEIDFKWDEAFNFEGKTGPYVQYTHARIRSLLRKAEWQGELQQAHPIYQSDLSWNLIYLLQQYPGYLIEATKKSDPSQVAKFLLDLCQQFNRFYANERFIIEDKEEQAAKLALAQKVAETIKHGLSMLTISAPEAI